MVLCMNLNLKQNNSIHFCSLNEVINNPPIKPRSYKIFLWIISRLIPSKYQFIYSLMPWIENYKKCLNPMYMNNFSLKKRKDN